QRLRGLRATVLGDDLYCHQPFCQQLLDQQVDFILVCREDSHTTLYDHLQGMALPTVTTQRWTGKVQEATSCVSLLGTCISTVGIIICLPSCPRG
ncbi:MAG: hypothetical protein KGQ93_08755, partial [Cyanobacteria bacterium REEB459]|nr:hypothetical protein [Cyanobacteria bacterium REEB459]